MFPQVIRGFRLPVCLPAAEPGFHAVAASQRPGLL